MHGDQSGVEQRVVSANPMRQCLRPRSASAKPVVINNLPGRARLPVAASRGDADSRS